MFSIYVQGRKKAKSKKASSLPFDWSDVKKDFLNITTQLLEINIVSLWEPPVAEEEFVKYVFPWLTKLVTLYDVMKS